MNKNGFHFNLLNETDGRLDPEYYGGTFVSYNYVKQLVDNDSSFEILNYIQLGIAKHDVYLIRKKS